MYLEHFLRARNVLSRHGLKPCVVVGKPLSENDIKAADAEMGVSMPSELRQFYLELGDGFAFIPDERRESPLVGWDYMHLRTHVIVNEDFRQHIDEEVLHRINYPRPRVDPFLLRQEANRRKSWMPFYGFGGSGELLCLDLAGSPPSVHFHEPEWWVTATQGWDFQLASSFTEFFEKWSQYHFLTPLGDWLNFCRSLEGTFDWAPEHFPHV